jgi:hypothetical protein
MSLLLRAVAPTEPRGVVGFEDRVLGAHGPLVIAAGSVSRSRWSRLRAKWTRQRWRAAPWKQRR